MFQFKLLPQILFFEINKVAIIDIFVLYKFENKLQIVKVSPVSSTFDKFKFVSESI